MDIRIPVIAAVTLLISLSEAASLVPTKTGYECDDTSVYGTCAEIVAKHSLQDILTNMCSFYLRWRECVIEYVSVCGTHDGIVPTGWLDDRCADQKNQQVKRV